MWPQCVLLSENVQSGMYVFLVCFFICGLKFKQELPVVAQAHFSSDKSKYTTGDCIDSLPFVIIVLLGGRGGGILFSVR